MNPISNSIQPNEANNVARSIEDTKGALLDVECGEKKAFMQRKWEEEVEKANSFVDSCFINVPVDSVQKDDSKKLEVEKPNKESSSNNCDKSDSFLTNEELQILVTQHQIHGDKWHEIAKVFPGRTPNQLMNLWNDALRNINIRPSNSDNVSTEAPSLNENSRNENNTAPSNKYKHCIVCGYAFHVNDFQFHNCRRMSPNQNMNQFPPAKPTTNIYGPYYTPERKVAPYYNPYTAPKNSSFYQPIMANPYQQYYPQGQPSNTIHFPNSRQYQYGYNTPRVIPAENPPLPIQPKESRDNGVKKEETSAFVASKQEATRVIEFLKHSNWNSSKDSKDDGGTGNSSLSRSESSSLSRSDDRDLQNHSEHDNFNESSRDTSQVMKEEREEKLNSKNNRISNSVGYYNQRNAQGKFVKINLKTKVPDSQPDSTANVQPKRRGRKSLKTLQQDQLNEINKAKKMKYDLYEVSFDEDESSISDSSGEKDEPSRPRSEHHRFVSLSINDFDSRLTRSNRRKFEEEKPERKVNVFTTKRSRKPRNKPQEVSIREGSAFMYLLEYVAEVYQMEMMVETTNIFHSDQGDDLEF